MTFVGCLLVPGIYPEANAFVCDREQRHSELGQMAEAFFKPKDMNVTHRKLAMSAQRIHHLAKCFQPQRPTLEKLCIIG